MRKFLIQALSFFMFIWSVLQCYIIARVNQGKITSEGNLSSLEIVSILFLVGILSLEVILIWRERSMGGVWCMCGTLLSLIIYDFMLNRLIVDGYVVFIFFSIIFIVVNLFVRFTKVNIT